MKNILLISVLWLTALFAQAGTTKITYYVNDALGSPVVAMNQAGDVIWRKTYEPYGKASGVDGDNRVGYTGHVEEQNGLVYAGARYYDPAIGIFASDDPVRFNENNPMSFNRYAYANNNPYKYVDPDGRSCVSANGTTTCLHDSGNSPQVSFPTPAGWPSTMNSGSDKNYHSYDKRVAADSSKADAIRAGIANDPTPGNDKPASAGGTNNNASPTIFGHDNPISSPVKTYLTESGVTVNVTQPGHPLFPGYVVRSVDTAGVVHNAGEGTGALQAPDSLAADRINGVWISQTKEIIDGIK